MKETVTGEVAEAIKYCIDRQDLLWKEVDRNNAKAGDIQVCVGDTALHCAGLGGVITLPIWPSRSPPSQG